MGQSITFSAEKRSTSGKGAARRLRSAGLIPAVVYGRGREPESLTLAAADFEKAVSSMHGDVKSTVFDIDVDGTTFSALIREIQRHPFKSDILHIDFYEIHAGEEITVDISIHLTGIPAGVKNDGGVLDQPVREIEISVLPRNIPEHVELDVSALEIGDSLHVSDIEIEDATILTELSKTVCTVVPPRKEEEPEVEVEEEEIEPELIGEEREDEEESGEEEAEDREE